MGARQKSKSDESGAASKENNLIRNCHIQSQTNVYPSHINIKKPLFWGFLEIFLKFFAWVESWDLKAATQNSIHDDLEIICYLYKKFPKGILIKNIPDRTLLIRC